MGNKEIARLFSLLAGLMELHGENAFKTKAYANAYLVLRKWERPLEHMTPDEIDAIPGIGSSVSSKIKELFQTGSIDALEKVKAKTPEGIQQLLSIKGLGPKKVRVIWDELKVESPTELLYACQENRLVQISGFGLKTQEDLKQKIAYYLDSRHKYLFGHIKEELESLIKKMRKALPGHRIEWAGDVATCSPVITQLTSVISPEVTAGHLTNLGQVEIVEELPDGQYTILVDERLSIRIYTCEPHHFMRTWSEVTMSPELFETVGRIVDFERETHLEELLEDAGYPGLPVELLDYPGIEQADQQFWSSLIQTEELRGILHNHSTWSDGINTLEEMAVYVRDAGYQYFAICDHSRSAFYANGLSIERVLDQMQEIEALNQKLAPFKIYKGIESDILGDGSLDYDEEILKQFDLVVASIHSNLNMDQDKAMRRLIRAIENPYTKIMGHPTGRLLLAREGYPIDHRKVIDACAANGVAIELNANPLRLDIDYSWLEYCMEKEVWVAINPDAHSRAQVDYVRYGVLAARKGALRTSSCLNALSGEEFERWLRAS